MTGRLMAGVNRTFMVHGPGSYPNAPDRSSPLDFLPGTPLTLWETAAPEHS